MNIGLKYNVKDWVRIISTNIVGIIISVSINICDSGTSIQYQVSYPSCNNEPDAKMFFECELEEVENTSFGFGDK